MDSSPQSEMLQERGDSPPGYTHCTRDDHDAEDSERHVMNSGEWFEETIKVTL